MAWVDRRAVVEDPILRIVVVAQQPSKLSGVAMHHGQVQWSEILVKGKVGEVVVDIEEESVLKVLRWLDVTDPVQLVYRANK